MPVSHNSFAALTAQDKARFLSKVQPGPLDECWEWSGSKDRNRYGLFRFSGKTMYAARIAYWFFYKTNPGDLYVLHHCDNPPCCNPHHLHLGDDLANVADRSARGRQARGERMNTAKLTAEKVREIRERKTKGERASDLATEFSVHLSSITDIISRKSWRHVE